MPIVEPGDGCSLLECWMAAESRIGDAETESIAAGGIRDEERNCGGRRGLGWESESGALSVLGR